MPTICTVTGQISDIFAGALGELKVEFSSAKTNAYKSGDDVISIKNLRTKTDTNGILTVDLVPGQYTMRLITSSRRVDETQIVVPEAVTASLANLIVSPIPQEVDAAVQAVLNAQSARDEANAARDAASVSETNAATSAANASTSASDSENAKVAAQAARAGAEAAQTVSETAQSGSQLAQISAETARDESQTFASQSQASATNANNAQIAAETARTASESVLTSVNAAKTAAEAAQSNAETAANNANTSESNAFTSATTAASAADTTTAARDQALAYRDTAENHKDAAETASANAQSAVAYLNLSGAEATLAVNAVAVWKGLFPSIPLSEQVTKSWFSELGPMPTMGMVVAGPNGATAYSLDTGSPVAWAPIQRGTGNPLWSNGDIIPTSIGWDGATLLIGQNGAASLGGLSVFDFLNDEAYLTINNDTTYYNLTSIANRNSGTSLTTHSGSKRFMGLVDRNINAIATYAAPNAPLNEAGQPISVVAVGTDGGGTVILEDGSSTNSTSIEAIGSLAFTEVGGLWCGLKNSAHKLIYAEDYTSDGWGSNVADEREGIQDFTLLTRSQVLAYARGQLTVLGYSGATSDAVNGVMTHYPNYQDQSKGLSRLQTPDFATPLMLGDVKGSFLQEADDTDLVGATPLDDDFSGYADTVGLLAEWVELSSARGNVTLQTEKIRLDNDGSGNCFAFKAISTVPGKRYLASAYSIKSGAPSPRLSVGTTNTGTDLGFSSTSVSGFDHEIYFTAESSTTYIHLLAQSGSGSASDYAEFDNVRVDLATPDRSTNGKGLIINTGLDVNPVFPGAKTMWYSGFSATKYLWQPHNVDLNAGTGDFYKKFWLTPGTAGTIRMLLARGDDSSNFVDAYLGASNTINFRTGATGSIISLVGAIDLSNITAEMITLIRKSGILYAFVGDRLDASIGGSTGDLDLSNAILSIGKRSHVGPEYPHSGALSCLCIGLGAPTPEQVRVAYLAERPRFYGGAVDPTLPETALDISLDSVTGLLWMIGATKVWAMDGNGYLVDSTLADKGTAAHNRIDMFDGEPVTWEYAA